MLRNFINSSTQRRKVMKSVARGGQTPSEISKVVGMRVQNVSRALRQLGEKGLVECTTPERRMNREYQLTERGNKVAESLSMREKGSEKEFEMEVARVLDGPEISYMRNARLEGEKFPLVADFLIEAEQTLLVEVKVASSKSAMHVIKEAAFKARDLKNTGKDLKTILVIGRLSREGELGQEAIKLEDPEYFDRIFFEDELEEFVRYLKNELKNKDQSTSRSQG